jgi:RNA polymerase sigma-70 factor, ECF subfamily
MTGYVFAGELISREVYAARLALTQGLTQLRVSMHDMLSLAVRGEGGAKRIRSRPHTNESPSRLAPGGNSKPVGGRVATPARPPATGAAAIPAGPIRPTPRPRSGRWSSGRRRARPRRSA